MDRLLEHFRNRQENIIRLMQQIVEIESPSKDASGSSAVADWLGSLVPKVPCITKTERIKVERLGEHVIFRAFESDAKPALLLGHTDTVHPRGTKQQNPTRIEDGKLYGCGTFDMKANIVVMLEVLRAFSELGLTPKRPVNILLSCDEEIGSHSGREIVEREARNAEVCLVSEPSANGRLKTARKGTGTYIVKAHGIPAHAGLEPEKGASAILELSRQIVRIHGFNDPEKGTTVNVCTIRGGTTSNVIPSIAECEVDVRFTSQKEAVRIEKRINELKAYDERVRLEVIGEINRPPLERTEAVARLFERARAIAASFDYELGETQVGGASDGNFVGAMGVPVLDGLGITGDGAHTLREHIVIDDISKRATLLARLLLEV